MSVFESNKNVKFPEKYFTESSIHHIGIVTATWHSDITNRLKNAAVKRLMEAGLPENSILLTQAPGSFELPLIAKWLFERDKFMRGVICLGCVIKGDTPHFEYVCEGMTHGLMKVSLEFSAPVINGVITALNSDQAIIRSREGEGNKGLEAAESLIQILNTESKLLK